MSGYYEREDIAKAIDKMNVLRSKTNPADALKMACKNILTKEKGERKDKQNVVIMLTDGEKNIGSDPESISHYCRTQKNAKIFGIGVTNDVNFDQLKTIVSRPVINHIFNSTTFSTLESLLTSIAKNICVQ